MQGNVKNFFVERKELVIFLGVLVVVFIAILMFNNRTTSDDVYDEDDTYVDAPDYGDDKDYDDKDEEEAPKETRAKRPVIGEYVIVRTFFDRSLPIEYRVNAVINRGDRLVNSTGLSFANESNEGFEVLSILPGEVIKVKGDNNFKGYTVIIRHSDNVISKYSSLSEVNVKEGDTVKAGDLIGKSGKSINDNEAGNHVHLQVSINDRFVNPASVFDRTINEIGTAK